MPAQLNGRSFTPGSFIARSQTSTEPSARPAFSNSVSRIFALMGFPLDVIGNVCVESSTRNSVGNLYARTFCSSRSHLRIIASLNALPRLFSLICTSAATLCPVWASETPNITAQSTNGCVERAASSSGANTFHPLKRITMQTFQYSGLDSEIDSTDRLGMRGLQ